MNILLMQRVEEMSQRPRWMTEELKSDVYSHCNALIYRLI